MKTQNQIKRTLSQPEAIEQINNMLDTNTNINRTKMADLICEQFSFYNPCGERQRSGCLKALRKLEQDGFIVLPVPNKTGSANKSPRRLEEPAPELQGVSDEVGKICELKLVSVETEEYMRILNELMIQDHPRGVGPLVGRTKGKGRQDLLKKYEETVKDIYVYVLVVHIRVNIYTVFKGLMALSY